MSKYETVLRIKSYSEKGKLVSTIYSVPYGEFNSKKEADLFTKAKRADDKPQERLNGLLKEDIKKGKIKSPCAIEEWVTRKRLTAKARPAFKKVGFKRN